MAVAVHTLRRKSNKPLPDKKERAADRSFLPTRRGMNSKWNEFVLGFKKVFGLFVLVPWCLFSFIAFTELLVRSAREGEIWSTQEFVWFGVGVGAWLILFSLFKRMFMIAYVFGHEWSHLLAAKMCGAVVYDWHVGRDGGWVDTNKSNTFISLAPYLVPFYTVAVLLLYGIAGLFVNLDKVENINLGVTVLPFDALKTLCFCIGMTWCFHFTYTLNTLRIEQSDVKRNGRFFSAWLIVLCNLHIIAALLIVASPSISWLDGLNSLQAAAKWTFGNAAHFIANMAHVIANGSSSVWHVFADMFDKLHTWKVD
jgi:hypothetical protein